MRQCALITTMLLAMLSISTYSLADEYLLNEVASAQSQSEDRFEGFQENRPLQQDTVIYKDSARLALEAKTRMAWRRSLIVPGWGQVTNGGIWWIKVPVIYGGFVTTGLVFEFNNRYYKSILKDVQYRLANNHAVPPNSPYDYIAADQQGTNYLINAKDYYRRNRDYMILITLGWYALNAVEAYVDSMLKNRWEIGDGLTVQINPTIIPATAYTYSNPLSASAAPVFGINLKINLK